MKLSKHEKKKICLKIMYTNKKAEENKYGDEA